METKVIKKTQVPTEKSVIRVLLVEDDAVDSRLTKQLLASCSRPVEFIVGLAESLSTAVACLNREEYDILLLDLGLPDSSGIDTVRKVREVNPHIPIVVLTVSDDEEMALLAIKNGAVDYLVKDQPLENLLARTLLYALEREKEKKLILDTNHRLQKVSQRLLKTKQEIKEKNRALEKAHEELESRVEERTVELTKANETLRAIEVNLHTLIKQNADGIIVIDHDGIVRFVNDAAESLFGRRKEEFIGEMFGFAIVKDKTTEIEVIRKGGEIVTAEMRVAEITWEGEKVYLASLHDITERKRAEEKLKETMKMKLEFTSMVSHELRTPLTAIKEGIALVADGLAGELNNEQQELLGIAKKNIDRLARLINDILDFHKLESDKMRFNLELNDVNEVVKEVYETMLSPVKSHGLDLVLELDSKLPKVRFDRDRITQVLTNLVTNSIKFTKKGSVTISTSKNRGAIKVSVADTGCGIEKEDLPKIFDEFEQLDNGSERKVSGTGLGLAISKEIIEQHHGEIWVESKFDKGTKFTFTLPVYSIEKLFEKQVNKAIKDSRANDAKVSVIIASVSNFNELKQQLSSEQLNSALKEMKVLFEGNLPYANSQRLGDTVLQQEGFNDIFVILVNCDKEKVSKIEQRLKQATNAHFATQNLAGKVNLLFGCATYPNDAKTNKELIKKAREAQHKISQSV